MRYIYIIKYVLILIAIAAAIACIASIECYKKSHNELRDAIRNLSNENQMPISREYWDHIVVWTLNLHENCDNIEGGLGFQKRKQLTEYIALHKSDGLATILYIWDFFALHTKNGQLYKDHHYDDIVHR